MTGKSVRLRRRAASQRSIVLAHWPLRRREGVKML